MKKTIVMACAVPPWARRWKSGPWVGIAALQEEIHRSGPSWLRVDPFRAAKKRLPLADDEMGWYWSWHDVFPKEVHCAPQAAAEGRPFIMGPFFNPGDQERSLMVSPACRLLLCLSPNMLVKWLGVVPDLATPVLSCPMPIDPLPEPPLPVEHDVLVYVKSGRLRRLGRPQKWLYGLIDGIRLRFPNAAVLHYGKHGRAELYELARRSAACLQLTCWESHSLLQSEVLCAGCPLVGTPAGTTWIASGPDIGRHITEDFGLQEIIEAVEQCHAIDRQAVRDWAVDQVAPNRVLQRLLPALDAARH